MFYNNVDTYDTFTTFIYHEYNSTNRIILKILEYFLNNPYTLFIPQLLFLISLNLHQLHYYLSSFIVCYK